MTGVDRTRDEGIAAIWNRRRPEPISATRVATAKDAAGYIGRMCRWATGGLRMWRKR